MDKQRRLKLAQILKSKGEASSKGVGDSIPSTSETAPTSPSPRPQHPPTTASPPPLSKDEHESAEGQVFKRRRTTRATPKLLPPRPLPIMAPTR